MSEQEEKAFRAVYEFYEKWRSIIIETDEQWAAFGAELGVLAAQIDAAHNPLGYHLADAMIETFNDMYRDGMLPVPANYFGRDDIST